MFDNGENTELSSTLIPNKKPEEEEETYLVP